MKQPTVNPQASARRHADLNCTGAASFAAMKLSIKPCQLLRRCPGRNSQNRWKSIVRLLGLAAVLWSHGHHAPASAAITVLDYYRLGENDVGATNGGVITNAKDTAAVKNLIVIGGPVWTNDVSVAAAAHTASSLSAYFAGSQYGTNAVLSTVTDNFGIEAWVKVTTTSGNHIIAYNGIWGTNGWGLYQNGSLFRASFGGVLNVGAAFVTLNEWTHLALVRSNGTATLYANGVFAGSAPNAPIAPSVLFSIGAAPADLTTNRLAGYLDEVRVFTFAADQFSTKDLLNVAYSSEALAGPGSALAFDGANDFAQATPTGLTTNDSLTVEGWIYRAARGVNVNAAIASKSASGAPSSSSGEWMLGYGWGTDVIFRNYCISNGWAAYNLPSDGDLGQWHHLAGVYDNTSNRVRLYVDGLLRADLAAQRPLGTNGQPVWIGRTGSDYLNGQLDEVRVWRTARTTAEIQYNMGRSLLGNQPGLVAYWRCNEKSGLTTADATTNAFTAGLTNGVAWVASTVPFVPTVATQPATALTSTGATLNATINPRGAATTAWFEWGIGSLYSHQTAPTAVGGGNSLVSFSHQLTGLTAGMAYHYRVVTSNSLGIVRGWENRFWAPALRLLGANPLTHFVNTAFTDPGATNTASPQAITAGAVHNLTRLAGGAVIGWGDNYYGQTAIPDDATNASAIGAGFAHSLAVRADGRGLGWGASGHFHLLNRGQADIPGNAYNVVAVAGGYWHSLALRADGSVLGWGSSEQGQSDIPAGAANVVAIAAGDNHSLAVRADGSVIGWGQDFYGQIDIPANATNLVAISAGQYHSLALRADGTVVGWGGNDDGQTNVPASATNVVAIASGNAHNLALRADGTVVGWGGNDYGQTNVPPSVTNVVAIAASYKHSLALRADGRIIAWGDYLNGLTNIPPGLTNLSLPITVSGSVNTGVPGVYQLTYSTTNALGAAVSATRTVIVYGPPAATTLAASSVTTNTATLNATINPNAAATAFYFEYGPTAAYGSFSPTNSLAATNAVLSTNRTITGLAPGTLYHFRVVASNNVGTTNGGDLTFTTPGPPTVTTQPATAVTNTAALLNATIIPNGVATTHYFEYGLTTAYGSNSPAQVVPDSGLNFNGVIQYALRAGSLNGLVLGNSTHTVEAWLKPTLTPASREWVVLLSNTSAGAHHWLLNADGSAQIGSYGGAQVNPQLNSNVWTHLAASFDGTNLRVYTNGVLAGTVAASFNLLVATLNVAQANFGESYYGGGMDELRIWNTARTASQIQTNLSRALAGNETGLIAYYRMDEGTGSVLGDASGHTNNLQTANHPTWTTGASGIQSLSQTSISGLDPGTLYHFRVVASNSVGTTTGADLTFITAAVAPSATTQPATEVTNTAATLNGMVNPNGAATTVYLEYGPTAAYGSFSPTNSLPAANVLLSANSTITGLAAGTLYHFRIVAVNNAGTTSGGDLTFTTTAAAQASSPALTEMRLLGDGSFQFGFTNTPGASFSVLATTNLALPLSEWTLLTNVVESPAGQFRFTDLQATTNGQRFYRVRSP